MALLKLVHHAIRFSCSMSFQTRRAFLGRSLSHQCTGHQIGHQEQFLNLSLFGGESLKLSPTWLRDHCRCSNCYNLVTNQRNFDIITLDQGSVSISSYSQNDNALNICWSDGHKSTFSIPWLLNNTYDGKYHTVQGELNPKVITWDNSTIKSLHLQPILFRNLLFDEKMLVEVYRRVLQYGFCNIEQVPPNENDTVAILERVCRMSNTVFGTFWETGTNFDHKDTGYLNDHLEAHTDTTYFTEAQGYLVFHCTHFNGTGGESFLVDGFHVAKQLKSLDPTAYDYLSRTKVTSEYIEPGEHFSAIGSCFRHHPVNRQLEQVRFNMLDRAPLSSIPQSEVDSYYRHLKTMAALVKLKDNEHWFRLSPGTVMIIDNWRLLHGRASYQGERILRGCYYSRSDFMSKARHYGIAY